MAKYFYPELNVVLFDVLESGEKVFLDEVIKVDSTSNEWAVLGKNYDKIKMGHDIYEHQISFAGRNWLAVFKGDKRSYALVYLVATICFLLSMFFLAYARVLFITAEKKIKSGNLLKARFKEKIRELTTVKHKLTGETDNMQRFAYVIAHDLKEPLRTIYSFLQLLYRKLDPIKRIEVEEYYRYILTAVVGMRNLIDNLHQIAVLGHDLPPKTIVDIKLIMIEIRSDMHSFFKETNAVIKENYQEVHRFRGYAPLIHVLLRHILHNSLKFRKKDTDPEVVFNVKVEEKKLIIEVRDNGIGIKLEYLDNVFLSFKRFHSEDEFKGSGIGLPSCKKIVNIHGGKIWLESKEGEGTSVFITLPLGKVS